MYMRAAKVCNEGDVRLVNGGVSYEGRIEYCNANSWGTVCDRGWTEVDAGVACYQLGYPRESNGKAPCVSFVLLKSLLRLHYKCRCCGFCCCYVWTGQW